MGHIRALAGEVTVLAITHRRSVVTDADRVVELGGAQIESLGRPAQP